jgi:phosphatidylserine/phosphatidylglycerophosphate/cardiolipin synthase-like enzyme
MRFKSERSNGFQAFAVSGVNTISFGIDADDAARQGLLGFAVERHDPTEDERYFMYGFKVFKSVFPDPDPGLVVNTFDQPIQSFVWDDFTAKPDRPYEYFFYPLRGKPRNLDRSAPPVRIKVKTEPLFSNLEHDIFFNRGVASSQAYVRRFGNQKPDALASPLREEALDWLSRELDEALLKFIGQTAAGDQLLCCFYEFRYRPVAAALQEAIVRGVDVQLIVDAKVNETIKDGQVVPSFPREENLALIADVGIPAARVHLREARPNDIQHNKFMVRLQGGVPQEVWTGSTNISAGGIFGQTNVGHWVRNQAVAEKFRDYWLLLQQDLGARDGDTRTAALARNKEQRQAVEALLAVPTQRQMIAAGTTPVFSPRSGLDVLEMYVDLVDTSQKVSCVTLAFGINKLFKDRLVDNVPTSPVVFLLLEKKDKPNPQSTQPFVAINATHNVYKAWGSFLQDPLYQWSRETNARILQLNQHVSYIHSKFLLSDPLGDDPIVITGSANFSAASTNSNDENMLIIRGDRRVADIYFTEFNRLFNHYYFRAVVESLQSSDQPLSDDSLFLVENASWINKYAPGKLRSKRLDMFVTMAGIP